MLDKYVFYAAISIVYKYSV